MTATTTHHIDLDLRRVREVMHQGIVGCAPDTPIPAVARLMNEHRIHCVVVGGLAVDGHGARLVWGVVSDLDLARAAMAGDELTAGQIAATEPVSASPRDTLAHVARLMGDHDVAHVVVVDDADGEPIGVISTLDVARALAGA